jgi:hypothetical protein
MACCMSLAQCGKGGLSAAKAGFRTTVWTSPFYVAGIYTLFPRVLSRRDSSGCRQRDGPMKWRGMFPTIAARPLAAVSPYP